MDKYKISIYPKAFKELDEIFKYIAIEKQSPENAKAQTDRIRQALQSLEVFPQSHQERLEGRYAKRGYRQLLIDNYIVIYKINEVNKMVYIVTIQYAGRNL